MVKWIFSATYPPSHLTAMACSVRWVQIAIFQGVGPENKVIRSHLVRKQDEMLDSRTFSHLTEVDVCGNDGVVPC